MRSVVIEQVCGQNTLRVGVRSSTARAPTGAAKEHIDTLLRDLREFIDANQNDFDPWVLSRELRNFAKQHASRHARRQPNLELATLGLFGAELVRCVFEPLHDLNAVAIEARAFLGELQ